MIITFCGHKSFFATEEVRARLLEFLEKTVGDGSASFYLGGYGAFDEFAYLCCKEYQKTHSAVRLVFITPYITEDYQRNHLSANAKRYDEILYPNIENRPLSFCDFLPQSVDGGKRRCGCRLCHT